MIWRAACHRKLALKYIKSALAITHRGKVSLRLFLFHALGYKELENTSEGEVDENTGPDDGC